MHLTKFLMLACLSMTLTPQHVMRVIDGDTFVLYAVGVPAEEHVRVLGVDTPEHGQPLFVEAGQFTHEWLVRGPFELTTCKRDSFGRLLATVSRGSQSLAVELVKAGYQKPGGL